MIPLFQENQLLEIVVEDLHPEFKCPICLDIFTETVTISNCMHRFCNSCLTDALRLGKKECPTCRSKCPTKRNFIRDIRFDSLIKIVYPEKPKIEIVTQDRAFEKGLKKLLKATRAGFVQSISKEDLLDAVSLNSSDMDADDVEITVKNVDDETKSLVIKLPEYSRVENLIERISISNGNVKVGVKKQKSITWIESSLLIKSISKVSTD